MRLKRVNPFEARFKGERASSEIYNESLHYEAPKYFKWGANGVMKKMRSQLPTEKCIVRVNTANKASRLRIP